MDDDLRPEYDLTQLLTAVCGEYAERYRAGTNLVLLAPDVAHAFLHGGVREPSAPVGSTIGQDSHWRDDQPLRTIKTLMACGVGLERHREAGRQAAFPTRAWS